MKRLLAMALLLASSVSAADWIDLTHSFDSRTIYWPTANGFKLTEVHKGPTAGGYWYESNDISASEHGGTHLDAPVHFARGRWTNDQIPLDVLTGSAVVVDISKQARRNPDYRLTVRDIERWEARHGRIPAGSIFLLRTGWGRFWPDKKRYLGTDRKGDVANLHFPGFSAAAATLLAHSRRVKMVGLDTASLDHGQSKDFRAHQLFGEANIPGLENIANLDRLPPTGATIVALPMKITGGSGGPVRIIARAR
jgi:kynurenine formamidase